MSPLLPDPEEPFKSPDIPVPRPRWKESLWYGVGIVLVHLLIFAASAAFLIFLPYAYGTKPFSLRPSPSMETLLKDNWHWVLIRGVLGGVLGLIIARVWWKQHR